MPSNCYQIIVVKCHSNKPCSDSDFALAQCAIKSSRLFSDSNFAVAQCVIKSSRLFSDLDFAVIKYAFTQWLASTNRCYEPI
jgi:hypothetical protein